MDSSPLADLIKSRIRQLGPMDLGEYMALCLGHPKHGYYMTRDPFGLSGDFTTAPEIGQMFGEMIALWLADLWMKFGSPSEFILLEVGPGRGTLMDDILRSTKKRPGFHEGMKLHLMEMSPVLREAQKEKLTGYDPVWIDDLARLPPSIPAFIVGNEFLDALPVRQLVLKDGQWRERVVSIGGNDTLVLGEKDADPGVLEHLSPTLKDSGGALKSDLEEGIYETSPVLNHILKSVDILLKKQKGVALFVDYGHVRSAAGDTLQAVRGHKYVSIFETPGTCDLSAHVDFENVVVRARSDGIDVRGPVTQGAFLKGLGIEIRAERLKTGATESQGTELDAGLKRLIDTEQMGSLFKAIALCSEPEMQIEGFHETL